MIEWRGVLVRQPMAETPFSLVVEKGVTALLAPAPSRARALLRVAAGVDLPRAGAARIKGATPRSALRTIGYVAEIPSFPRGLLVAEFLEHASAFRGSDPKRAHERLESFGLGTLRGKELTSLLPEVQKAIATVEALSSEVVFLEEPFVALDPRAYEPLRATFRKGASDGRTILFTTASTRDALLATHVVVITPERAVPVEKGDAMLLSTGGEFRLELEGDAARPIVSRLTGHDAVLRVDFDRADLVTITTRDPRSLLEAVQREASSESGLRRMSFAPRGT